MGNYWMENNNIFLKNEDAMSKMLNICGTTKKMPQYLHDNYLIFNIHLVYTIYHNLLKNKSLYTHHKRRINQESKTKLVVINKETHFQ